jgi:hypothetical protein
MTAPFKSRSRRIASTGVAERNTQPRRLAATLTGGAVVLALALGVAMPAKADKKDDLAKALIGALVIGVIVSELNDTPKPEPVKRPRVPSVCEIAIQGAQRIVSLYPESCLRDEGFAYALPRDCATRAKIFGRKDWVYSAQCLRDAGFRVEER